MNLPDGLLPEAWGMAGALGFAVLLVLACWRAPWRFLFDNDRAHAFLGACVALMVLWGIKAGVQPGLNFHLLGATLLTLMVGPALAFIGLSAVLGANTLVFSGGLWSLGWNALLLAAVPVAVSEGFLRLAGRVWPRHFFVYVFVVAFAGAALALAVTAVCASALLVASGAYPAEVLATEYLPYFLLLVFPEAVLTGSAIALMVVYRPRWVQSFDDALYLRR